MLYSLHLFFQAVEAEIFSTLHISLTYFSKLLKLCVEVCGLCGGLVDFLSGLFLFLFYSVVLCVRELS